MLLEQLLRLPIGAEVIGEIDSIGDLSGEVKVRADGSRMICWVDGFVTVPLGMDRQIDMYIAAHTRLPVEPNPAIVDRRCRRAGEESDCAVGYCTSKRLTSTRPAFRLRAAAFHGMNSDYTQDKGYQAYEQQPLEQAPSVSPHYAARIGRSSKSREARAFYRALTIADKRFLKTLGIRID